MVTPLRYPGSKNKLYLYMRYLVESNSIKTYVEPFVGGGSLACKLLLNGDVDRVIINDYDRSVYAFWYCVFYDTASLIQMIRDTEVTIEEWHRQRDILKTRSTNDNLLELGFSMLFCNRTNRSGILTAGVMGGLRQDGNCKLDCRFNKEKIIEKINVLSKLRDQVSVYNLDVNDFLNEIELSEDVLIFLDPPYYVKGPALYAESFKEACHSRLSNTLKSLKNTKWVLTYDKVDEVAILYEGFDKIDFCLNYSAARRVLATEVMYFSSVVDKGTYKMYLKQPE